MSIWVNKPPLGAQINWGHPLAKGLVGCWLMNEGGGNRIINSVNLAVGIHNCTWVPKGLSFTSALSQYVTLPDMVNDAKALTFSFSFSPWHNSIEDFVFYGGGNPDRCYLQSGLGNKFAIRLGSDANIESASSYTAFRNYTVTVTAIKSGPVVMYINGVPDVTSGHSTGLIGSSDADEIGRHTAVGEYFQGIIYNAHFYNRALSAQEVRQLYINPYQFISRGNISLDYYIAASGLSIPVAQHHYKMMRG